MLLLFTLLPFLFPRFWTLRTTNIMSNNQSNNTSTTTSPTEKQRWFPLESNPDLVNSYVRKLGYTHAFEFVDVFSTEEWALEMIAQPVQAVLLLYPLTEVQNQYQDAPETIAKDCQDVWFIRQRIGNACGTIALLHALLNGSRDMFVPNSWLDQFAGMTQSLTPLERAELLEQDNQIAQLHDQATSSEENVTNRGSLDDDLITHFIALVQVNGKLYELDGRKEGPICHGPCHNLLVDACAVVQKFMQRDPSEVRFTIMALAPKE